MKNPQSILASIQTLTGSLSQAFQVLSATQDIQYTSLLARIQILEEQVVELTKSNRTNK